MKESRTAENIGKPSLKTQRRLCCILIKSIIIVGNTLLARSAPLAEIEIMRADHGVSREGASAPYYRTALREVPAVVVFPVAVFGVGISPEQAQHIYQLALERARAACRPSIWELAHRACVN